MRGIQKFLREQRVRWLRDVEKMDEERAPVRARKFEIEGSKKDRLKKRWKEVMEKDMLVRVLKRSNAQDRSLWRLCFKKRLKPACEKNEARF